MRTFTSTNQPGFTQVVSADPRHVVAVKRAGEFGVNFAHEGCNVDTREGVVYANPDDAIVTGPAGDQWPVSPERFAERYRALPPTQSGKSGTYVALPNSVLALRMDESFQVVLADQKTRLDGAPGDWLVDYGDGSLGVVGGEIFLNTYQILSAG